MSNRKSRKRKRADTLTGAPAQAGDHTEPNGNEHQDDDRPQDPELNDKPLDSEIQAQTGSPMHENHTDDVTGEREQEEELTEEQCEQMEKEREVWEVFKEENYEILEQLPLSLHRAFSLMAELDHQVQEHEEKIVPSIRAYIAIRSSLTSENEKHQENPASHNEHAGEAGGEQGGKDVPTEGSDVPMPDQPMPMEENHRSPSVLSALTSPSKSTTAASDLQQPPLLPESSRQLFTSIAQLSEEVVRANYEKVNLARFSYGLVDRYIRHLDRAIKEQETSISIGLRPGTHLASIFLPEVVVPNNVRPPRIALSPSPIPETPAALTASAQEKYEVHELEAEEHGGDQGEDTPHEHTPVRRRRSRFKWSRKKKSAAGLPLGQVQEDATPESSGLTLTLPPLTAVASDPAVVDPDEPRYCFCNQVSFGEMIACDNPDCVREWFHYGCVGLSEAPDENTPWYCRECLEKMGSRHKRRRA